MTAAELRAKIESFQKLRIGVLGDLMYDEYRYCHPKGLVRAEPQTAVHHEEDRTVLAAGGAGNVVVNLAGLGIGKVDTFSVVGADQEALFVTTLIQRFSNVETENVDLDSKCKTVVKQRIFSNDQLVLQVDKGGSQGMTSQSTERLIASLTEHYEELDGLVISDYEYGVVSDAVLRRITELHERFPQTKLVVDSRRPSRYSKFYCDAIKPNWEELKDVYSRAVSIPKYDRILFTEANSGSILSSLNAALVAVTLDSDGCVSLMSGRPARHYPPSEARYVKSSVGAGDTFVSTLACAIAAKVSADEAVMLANLASNIVVTKNGTAYVTWAELSDSVA